MKTTGCLLLIGLALLAGCTGMGYRAIQDSASRDTVVINVGGALSNGTATASADVPSNGTFSVQGGVNVVVLKNMQIYNGGGTAASNDTRFVLEIPASAFASDNPVVPLGEPVKLSLAPIQTRPVERLLVVGDSWASAYRSDTRRDDGWPEAIGLPAELRQGVDGSTAVQWSADFNGMLSRALATDADGVVISLGGNDAVAIKSDSSNLPGKVDAARRALGDVVTKFQNKYGKDRVWVLLYANPWPDRLDATMATAALKGVMMAACPEGTQFWDTGAFLDASCFSNGDYHPNCEGTVREANSICELTGIKAVNAEEQK